MSFNTKPGRSSVALAAAFALIGGMLAGCSEFNDTSLKTPTPTPTSTHKPKEAPETTVPKLSPATQQFLTVDPTDLLPKEDRCASNAFIQNSLLGVDAGIAAYRQWSDAVSIPFKSSDPNAMLTEVRVEHCGNPTLLDMTIKAMKLITVDGWNVAAANPWMDEFLATADENGLRKAFLRKLKGSDDIFVTPEYQQYAALTNTLLARFDNVGIVTQASLTNWHLPGGGLVAGELARTELNSTQEGLPLLKLEITEKGQGCIWAGGYNVQDKRFETVACQVPPPPAPTTPVTPTTPTTPHHPSPSCTTCGGHTPTCTSCGPHGKNPALDPAQHGNAGNGGGRNETSGPGTYQPIKPADPPSTPRVNPAPPAPAPAPPAGSMPDPAPTPSQEPAPAPATQNDPATSTSCAPGVTTC